MGVTWTERLDAERTTLPRLRVLASLGIMTQIAYELLGENDLLLEYGYRE